MPKATRTSTAPAPTAQGQIAHPNNPGLSGYQHRRRNLLGALVGAPVAAAVPASAGEADDPHLEWERQLPGLRAAMQAEWDAEGPTYDALWERWIGLQDLICLTPARTPAGIAAQIGVALSSTEEGSTLSDNEVEGLRNAVRSLQQLAGSA